MPNEVSVKIVATGICHSDIVMKSGILPIKYPLVLGHEGAGIIEKVGSNVSEFKKGDHVVIGFASDGTCKNCRKGLPGACEHFAELNYGGIYNDGTHRMHTKNNNDISVFFGQSSFADHVVVNTNNLVKVSQNYDLRFLGPLGCGFMTGAGTVLNSLKPEVNSTLAVFGVGSVGLAAIMGGPVSSCKHVIAVDKNEKRLEVAKKFGATETINNTKVDIKKSIDEIVGNGELNYAVDTTGDTVVIKSALSFLAIKGKIATIGVNDDNITLNLMTDVLMMSRTIIGIQEGDAIPQEFIPKLIDLYQRGEFPINEITKFYKPSEINQAMQDSIEGETIKPVIIFDDQYQR